MESLRGKRLLLLGGSTWKDAIASYAKEHGITLIAAGNNPHAQYFEIADETYNVNSTDTEAMKNLIRTKKIDGVYLGGNDDVINVACEYVRDMGFPCYCTKSQWDNFSKKNLFKKLCKSVDLPVVPEIEIDASNLVSEAANINFPVITKPVDSSGSKGFSVCRNAEEFLIAYEKARQFSKSGKVIVEKFVKNDSVCVFYTFSRGEYFFSGLQRKYPVKYDNTGSFVMGLALFESSLTKRFREEFEPRIFKMFEKQNIREGNIWMEIFRDDNNYYFNEVGYRYGGSTSIFPVDYFYNINQLHSDIDYALTGKSRIFGRKSLIPNDLKRKKYYAIYNIHLKPGTIAEIIGVDDFLKRDNVIIIPTIKSVGDTVEDTGTFAQIFALVHFVFDTRAEFIETVNHVHKKIIIKDEAGNNLVNRMLDVENDTVDFF